MKTTCCYALLCLCLGLSTLTAQDREPDGSLQLLVPETSPVVSTDGTLSLRWTDAGAQSNYRLERSRDAQFSDSLTIYEGADLGTFVSGMTAGVWHYRLSALDAESGEPVPGTKPVLTEVRVEFVSARQVVWLMSAGAVTLVCIVGSVLTGYRRYRGWNLNAEPS